MLHAVLEQATTLPAVVFAVPPTVASRRYWPRTLRGTPVKASAVAATPAPMNVRRSHENVGGSVIHSPPPGQIRA